MVNGNDLIEFEEKNYDRLIELFYEENPSRTDEDLFPEEYFAKYPKEAEKFDELVEREFSEVE